MCCVKYIKNKKLVHMPNQSVFIPVRICHWKWRWVWTYRFFSQVHVTIDSIIKHFINYIQLSSQLQFNWPQISIKTSEKKKTTQKHWRQKAGKPLDKCLLFLLLNWHRPVHNENHGNVKFYRLCFLGVGETNLVHTHSVSSQNSLILLLVIQNIFNSNHHHIT